jgi:hypothetical protein
MFQWMELIENKNSTLSGLNIYETKTGWGESGSRDEQKAGKESERHHVTISKCTFTYYYSSVSIIRFRTLLVFATYVIIIELLD